MHQWCVIGIERGQMDLRFGGRVTVDLGFGCVCTGAGNCLSMLTLGSKRLSVHTPKNSSYQ